MTALLRQGKRDAAWDAGVTYLKGADSILGDVEFCVFMAQIAYSDPDVRSKGSPRLDYLDGLATRCEAECRK